jgi:predicted O-methyltransferase YrrM
MGKIAQDITQRLHPSNPYEGFDYQSISPVLQTWAGNEGIFKQLIDAIHPQLILEVGSWKGVSAIKMASILKEQSEDFAIVCIDTWLGSLEMLFDPSCGDFNQFIKHGYPTLYYQFLANICHLGYSEYIVPFPNTSVTAAYWFLHHKIQADLIYIDASHEEDEVYIDIVNYWKLLKPEGIMFGDDWSEKWPGVICATGRFAKENDLNLEIAGDKWVLQKPQDPTIKMHQRLEYLESCLQDIDQLMQNLND